MRNVLNIAVHVTGCRYWRASFLPEHCLEASSTEK